MERPREFRVTNLLSANPSSQVLPWSAILHVCPADYEKEIRASSDAIFTYTDEDDGETVTIGSGYELDQRLSRPSNHCTFKPVLGDRSPILWRHSDIFDIRRTQRALDIWRKYSLETPSICPPISHGLSGLQKSSQAHPGPSQHDASRCDDRFKALEARLAKMEMVQVENTRLHHRIETLLFRNQEQPSSFKDAATGTRTSTVADTSFGLSDLPLPVPRQSQYNWDAALFTDPPCDPYTSSVPSSDPSPWWQRSETTTAVRGHSLASSRAEHEKAEGKPLELFGPLPRETQERLQAKPHLAQHHPKAIPKAGLGRANTVNEYKTKARLLKPFDPTAEEMKASAQLPRRSATVLHRPSLWEPKVKPSDLLKDMISDRLNKIPQRSSFVGSELKPSNDPGHLFGEALKPTLKPLVIPDVFGTKPEDRPTNRTHSPASVLMASRKRANFNPLTGVIDHDPKNDLVEPTQSTFDLPKSHPAFPPAFPIRDDRKTQSKDKTASLAKKVKVKLPFQKFDQSRPPISHPNLYSVQSPVNQSPKTLKRAEVFPDTDSDVRQEARACRPPFSDLDPFRPADTLLSTKAVLTRFTPETGEVVYPMWGEWSEAGRSRVERANAKGKEKEAQSGPSSVSVQQNTVSGFRSGGDVESVSSIESVCGSSEGPSQSYDRQPAQWWETKAPVVQPNSIPTTAKTSGISKPFDLILPRHANPGENLNANSAAKFKPSGDVARYLDQVDGDVRKAQILVMREREKHRKLQVEGRRMINLLPLRSPDERPALVTCFDKILEMGYVTTYGVADMVSLVASVKGDIGTAVERLLPVSSAAIRRRSAMPGAFPLIPQWP